MQCPNCSSTLETINYEGIKIETCPGCEGQWLDSGELERIQMAVEGWQYSLPEPCANTDHDCAKSPRKWNSGRRSKSRGSAWSTLSV